MVTFAICEDEPYFSAKLESLLAEYGCRRKFKPLVRRFTGGEALLHSGREFDIILMDIRLPGADGLEIVQRLRECGSGSQLIFITAYPEYVFRAFDVDAVHYLVKPVSADRLFAALDKAVIRAKAARETAYLVVNAAGGSRKIAFRELLYCEAMDHQITIHTLTGEVRFFGTLDSIQEQLDSRFYRCHRSFLVNMEFVTALEPGSAVLEGGGKALVSRRKQQAFAHRLLEICRKGAMQE